MRIHYISYGISETGGYRHEKTLFDALVKYLGKTRQVEARQFRKSKLFSNVLEYLELIFWSFLKSGGDINIVTARTGISAMLRNMINKKEVWVVVHNFDIKDGKSFLLKLYYRLLFSILRSKHGRFKLIAVAPYWEKYFVETQGISHTCLFPNLFDTSFYNDFKQLQKNEWVHLGQFSSKNDPGILELATRLRLDGYFCYFSTLDPEAARANNGSFEIICFRTFNHYLEQVSKSCCTLALTRINEGWNRIAHESILVGTPVIGYARGGLGDLIKESNSMAVKNTDEAYICIRDSLWVTPEISFITKYDIRNAETYLQQICKV